jgi:hypothetical protein
MTCKHFDPHGANGAGVPCRAPVPQWCRGYREKIMECYPNLQYCSCKDVPDPIPAGVTL